MQDRTKKLIRSTFRRMLRWEFWPMWLFYPPVILAVAVLAIRYRGLRQLTAVNTSMHTGGLVDLDKGKNLLSLQDTLPDAVAKTAVMSPDGNLEGQLDSAMGKLQLDFPVILKPNSGQRGLDVAIISSRSQALEYLRSHAGEILLQEYIEGEEFGIFYMREPHKPQGFIFSITHKRFPYLVGDGCSTLEDLIFADERANYSARQLLRKFAAQTNRVLGEGERFSLVDIGSHCRGSLFIDGNYFRSAELVNRIDEISKAIPGYYFGRYDIRVPSADLLIQGNGLKVIEANGLSSESTNIYDPKNSLITAYKTLFKQWNWAFKIARRNRLEGASISSYREIIAALRSMNR